MDYHSVWSAFENGRSFLITSHIHLDGDAVASELVVAKVLCSLNKKSLIVNEHSVPHFLRFLPGTSRIRRYGRDLKHDFDTAIVLDIGTWRRIGKVENLIGEGHTVLNIDHHRSNDGFGDIRLIDKTASSTGEILYRLLKANKFCIDEETAFLLYTAIFTDTGRFTYDNTTAETLRIAADLLDVGIDAQKIANEVYRSLTPTQLALLSRASSRLTLSNGGKIAYITLYWRDFEELNGTPDDTQEFAEIPRSVAGVVVGLYIREMEDGRVKVSMRSNGDVDLNAFAMRYGGGGHKSAAGVTFTGMSVEKVTRFIVAELSKELQRL